MPGRDGEDKGGEEETEKAGENNPIENLLKQSSCFVMIEDRMLAIAHLTQGWVVWLQSLF